MLSEEIGLWIPPEIVVKEHDDKPEGEEEESGMKYLESILKFFP